MNFISDRAQHFQRTDCIRSCIQRHISENGFRIARRYQGYSHSSQLHVGERVLRSFNRTIHRPNDSFAMRHSKYLGLLAGQFREVSAIGRGRQLYGQLFGSLQSLLAVSL